jgi:hypothetical protein
MVRIAFDVGGVLFTEGDFKLAPEAILSVRLCVEKFSSDNVCIISKAGPKYQDIILNRLHENDFFNSTGLRPENVHFVLEYDEKRLCCDQLHMDYIVDDNIKIIRSLEGSHTTAVWFGDQHRRCEEFNASTKRATNGITANNRTSTKIASGFIVCCSWKTVRKLIQRLPQVSI